MQQRPSLDPHDPGYRRLRDVRDADAWRLGCSGPRGATEVITRDIGTFLRAHLHLELSEATTLITHARTETARCLGSDIAGRYHDRTRDRHGHRRIQGQIGLRVPKDVIKSTGLRYRRHGQPLHRAELLHDTAFRSGAQSQQAYRGLVEDYRLAYHLHQRTRLTWLMERSLTHTRAHTLRTRVRAVSRRYRSSMQTDQGPREGLQVTMEREGRNPLVARWGGISLARNATATRNDAPLHVCGPRTALARRLLADTCDLCTSQAEVQVHHIRALQDLRRTGRVEPPCWVHMLAARQRTTRVVCRTCHTAIHAGEVTRRAATAGKTLESRVLQKA